MTTHSRTIHTSGAIACAIAILALTAGAALASAPSTTAYRFSSHPMISGTVATVNDRQMVVDTDQGGQVTLELDSRTMAPRDLGPGMVMRAEFLALEDCRFYAQRIEPIRSGMSTRRLQAYANTRDSREEVARDVPAGSGGGHVHGARHATAAGRVTLPQRVGEHASGPSMTAAPATADYRQSTRAMVSGRAIAMNDHRLVLVTDQGQAVGLAMDSRTMVPRDAGPGTVLRVEFSEMKDGRYYAKRVQRIDSGVVDREQTYANTRDSDFLLAQSVSDCGSMSAPMQHTMTSAAAAPAPVVPPVAAVVPAPVAAPDPPAPVVELVETLPQTASRQPLILLAGLLALGAAGALAIGRRLQRA